MSTKVTISVPAGLYRKAQALAKRRGQSVTQLLADAIRLLGAETGPDGEERDEALERERQAFIALHPLLLEKYAGEEVAIYQGQLIDHDRDGIALSRRIYAKYPDRFVWIAPVRAQPIEELRFRSPRIEQSA